MTAAHSVPLEQENFMNSCLLGDLFPNNEYEGERQLFSKEIL